MSKPVTMYECNVCGHKFNNEYLADDCEKSHYKPEKITKHNYSKASEYPEYVVIRLVREDGDFTNIAYYRDKN